MAPIVKNFITTTAAIAALSVFFAFAARHWIEGVEADINILKEGRAVELQRLAIVDVRYAEISQRIQNIESSILRIEDKIDRLIIKKCASD